MAIECKKSLFTVDSFTLFLPLQVGQLDQHYCRGENKVKLPEQCQKVSLHADGPGGCSGTVEVRTNEINYQHKQ